MDREKVYFVKSRYLVVFNPLNPPYQGDSKRKCVSPNYEKLILGPSNLAHSLSRAATAIESAQISDSQENYQVALARLEEIVTEQLTTAGNALEDWRDIVPEDVEELERKRQTDNKARDKQ